MKGYTKDTYCLSYDIEYVCSSFNIIKQRLQVWEDSPHKDPICWCGLLQNGITPFYCEIQNLFWLFRSEVTYNLQFVFFWPIPVFRLNFFFFGWHDLISTRYYLYSLEIISKKLSVGINTLVYIMGWLHTCCCSMLIEKLMKFPSPKISWKKKRNSFTFTHSGCIVFDDVSVRDLA